MTRGIGCEFVLAAHGAGDDSHANAIVLALAQRTAAAVRGVRVRAAFIKGSPSIADVLGSASADRCIVLPIMASEGHFFNLLRTEVLRTRGADAADNRLVLLRPVGTQRTVRTALAHDVSHALAARDLAAARTTVVVIGHGTTRDASSATAVFAAARAIASRTGVRVTTAFLDQSPTVERVLGAVRRGTDLLIVPFLLGGGAHMTDDLPGRVNAILHVSPASARRVEWLVPLGEHRWLPALVRQIVSRARKRPVVLRAGARSSALAKQQVLLASEYLASCGIALEHVPVVTAGDRDRITPLEHFADDALFSRDIDDALRSGAIDVAVHSLKDLPPTPVPGIVTAVVLPRGSAEDVLVSRGHIRLADLAPGARVGTSSRRRAVQISRLRPDVITEPVRGDVPARIALVARGAVDAVVLAAAGLERLRLTSQITDRFAIDTVVPAAGQGAIVVQCRADSPYLRALQKCTDGATARAVAAETAFASAVAGRRDLTAAAHATVRPDGIRLRTRLFGCADACIADAVTDGVDPVELGQAAARAALAQLAHAPGAHTPDVHAHNALTLSAHAP